ncbi:MAG: Fe-S protein assembly chaperone HscA, partial [Gammaproteobacteria bacterium]
VKPSYGLSDRDIETMLRESMEHAMEDKDARSLREQQVEADRVIEALDAALAEDGETMLNAAEREIIMAARQALITARQSAPDSKTIKTAMENVEKASAVYVARRMNASVQKAMAGHRVSEFKVESESNE